MAESKGFEPLRQGYPPTRFPIVLLRPLGQLSKNGSEGRTRTCDNLINSQVLLPTELLRNNIIMYSLATSYSHRGKPPTTIGAKELNFRVRYGNGCDLFAIITRLFSTSNTRRITASASLAQSVTYRGTLPHSLVCFLVLLVS